MIGPALDNRKATPERKEAALEKLLAPHIRAVEQLA
jgi:hypothetical protein